MSTPTDALRRAAVRRETQSLIASGDLVVPPRCVACRVGGRFHGRPGPQDDGTILSALEVHHLSYDDPRAVICLCRPCHRMVHNGRLREPITGRAYPRPAWMLSEEQRAARGLPAMPIADTWVDLYAQVQREPGRDRTWRARRDAWVFAAYHAAPSEAA